MTAEMDIGPPIWDPAIAASAGAGFAGILGAIVVAVTFQIVLTRDQPGEQPRQPGELQSLVVAPFSITLLLSAAYLYVVLSGTTQTTKPIVQACSANSNGPACVDNIGIVSTAAGMFAIGGSYLGLGAIALAFTFVLVVDGHPRVTNSAVRDGTFLFFTAACSVALLALVWGYRDATGVLDGGRSTVWDYLDSKSAFAWAVSGLVVGLAAGFVSQMLALFARGLLRLLTVSTATLFVVAPVYWYLLIQETPRNELPTGAFLLTQVMLAWVTVATGLFTYWLPQLSQLRDRAQALATSRSEVDRALFAGRPVVIAGTNAGKFFASLAVIALAAIAVVRRRNKEDR